MTLLHNPCDIMTLRQGLCNISWSDINVHATLGLYITNHATWIYDEAFSTQNIFPNMKFSLHQRPPRNSRTKLCIDISKIKPKRSVISIFFLKINFSNFERRVVHFTAIWFFCFFSLQCIHTDRAVHFSVSWFCVRKADISYRIRKLNENFITYVYIQWHVRICSRLLIILATPPSRLRPHTPVGLGDWIGRSCWMHFRQSYQKVNVLMSDAKSRAWVRHSFLW